MSISANYPTIRPSLLLDFANTEQLDPRVSFSRPTTATYYDANTTALAEQNLFKYSQDFTQSSAWTLTAVTDSIIAAPDGTTTGTTLTDTAVTNTFNVQQNKTGSAGSYTGSMYFQAGTVGYAYVQVTDGTFRYTVLINLSTGAFATSSSTGSPTGTSYTITQVGSWWRLAVTVNLTGSTIYLLGGLSNTASPTFSFGNAQYTGTGTGTIYVWGAQLEQRASATAYTANLGSTTTTNYIPVLQTASANQARFDHNPTTRESLGLLIEQQSTNLLTWSQDFSNAAWTKIMSSIAPNTNIAPDGTQTVSQLIEDTSNNSHQLSRILGNPIGAGTYTLSASFKQSGRQYVQMRFTVDPASTVLTYDVVFDLVNGTVSNSSVNGTTSTSNSIKSLGNGCYLCSITVGNPSGLRLDTTIYPSIYSTVQANPVYQGNGYSGIYIWGAQLEALSFPTSYIPTVASQVTRSGELVTITGANLTSWYQNNQGTWYVNGTTIWNATNVPSSGWIYYSASSGFVAPIYTNTAANAIYFYDNTNAAGVTAPGFGTRMQVSSSYGALGKFMVVNGGAPGSTTYLNNGFASPATVFLGANSGGTAQINGRIQKISYYPIQLTSAQQQSLTGS